MPKPADDWGDALDGPRVAVVAYDGLCTFEFGVAYEVFGLPRPEMGRGWYRYRTVAAEAGPLRAAGGLTIAAEGDLSLLSAADIVIVPGWRGADAPVPHRLREALRDVQARGARLASLCSGVFVLADAGVLDGRRATTHWRYVEALRRKHPSIAIEPDVLYVDNGDVLTAAGSAAGIDLCLHMVRRDFGAAAANAVARRLVVPPHRDGGQAQFIERPVPDAYEGRRLGAVVEWMRAHLGEPQPLAELASRAGMSLRTFQRRFEAMTGKPPGAWLIDERVAEARRLLEAEPSLSTDAIAQACGFDPAALRGHFQRRVGVTPSAYRRQFALSAVPPIPQRVGARPPPALPTPEAGRART
jgi:AraC family transcriptional regulator, transcriptional activator FtrA